MEEGFYSAAGITALNAYLQLSNLVYFMAYLLAVAHSMNLLVYTARIPSFRAALLPCVCAGVTTAAVSSVTEKNKRSLSAPFTTL